MECSRVHLLVCSLAGLLARSNARLLACSLSRFRDRLLICSLLCLCSNVFACFLHPWLLIRKFPRPARGWSHFLGSPGSTFRVQHFRNWMGWVQASCGLDVGLSSGALRAPELRISSRTPARASRAPARTKDFFDFGVPNFGNCLAIFVNFRV